jgi:hypothetical protein
MIPDKMLTIPKTEYYNYLRPFKFFFYFNCKRQENVITRRSLTRGDLTEVGSSTKAKKSFKCDAAKVWNNAPDKIRTSKTLTTAKKAIREHCKSLPI